MAPNIIALKIDPVNQYLRDNFEVLRHALSCVTWHFHDEGMSFQEARVLAHSILDIKPERWAAVQHERRRRGRRDERGLGEFRRRVDAFTVAYDATQAAMTA